MHRITFGLLAFLLLPVSCTVERAGLAGSETPLPGDDASVDAGGSAPDTGVPRWDGGVDATLPPDEGVDDAGSTMDGGNSEDAGGSPEDAGSPSDGGSDAGLDAGTGPITQQCSANQTCTCPAGRTCSFTCPSGGCTFQCNARSRCEIQCDGNCQTQCGTDARCTATCNTGCTMTCSGAESCNQSCFKLCQVQCGSSDSCSQSCVFGPLSCGCSGSGCD